MTTKSKHEQQLKCEIKLMAPTSEDLEKKVQGIKWTKEVSQTEARRKLEIKMYPFKQVWLLTNLC
jgi:hypothetical protein